MKTRTLALLFLVLSALLAVTCLYTAGSAYHPKMYSNCTNRSREMARLIRDYLATREQLPEKNDNNELEHLLTLLGIPPSQAQELMSCPGNPECKYTLSPWAKDVLFNGADEEADNDTNILLIHPPCFWHKTTDEISMPVVLYDGSARRVNFDSPAHYEEWYRRAINGTIKRLDD
ncbi:hypothetical protein [Rubinisphaera sp. JC750]|uniref:hypothetical protein n=1 Tax=Rubinisphaera sp. JC750 TaxID=2898658 RepID=UPI001F16A10F|nr:hypothetical protein [Rubinisphaera sp. JC750]